MEKEQTRGRARPLLDSSGGSSSCFGNPAVREVQGVPALRFKDKLRHNHFPVVALDASEILEVGAHLASANYCIQFPTERRTGSGKMD